MPRKLSKGQKCRLVISVLLIGVGTGLIVSAL